MIRYTFQLLILCLLVGLSSPLSATTLVCSTQAGNICKTEDKGVDTIIVPDGFYVPNVITPNGDGINDELTISCSSVSNFDIRIFNRQGIEIFESSSIEISWDGRTNAGVMVSDGTYYYILKATTATGENWNKAGYITVLGSRSGTNQ